MSTTAATPPKSTPIPITTSLTTSQNFSSPHQSQDQNQPQADSQPQSHPFPPPQTFTFLPQLYTLISHLSPLQSHSSTSQITGTPVASRVSRSPTLTRRTAASAPDQPANDITSGTATLTLIQTRSRDEIVEIKDLPALVYPLRQQIDRAKEVVKGMPDVGRSVEEQRREIAELEGRIEALKGRLRLLGGLAGDAGEVKAEDVVMQGVEG